MATPERGVLAPYLPFRTFTTALDALTVSCPDKLDTSVWPSMAYSVQAATLSAFKFLKLIDVEGVPQPLLGDLLTQDLEARKEALKHVIDAAYGEIMAAGLTRMTPTQLDGLIKDYGNTGQTLVKARRFFLHAVKEVGYQLSPSLQHGLRSPRAGGRRKRQSSTANGAATTAAAVGGPDGLVATQHRHSTAVTWEDGLLAKFPEFDPGWNEDLKKAWFEAFGTLMGLRKKEEEQTR